MPELPEVETVVRSIRPHIVGRRIRAAHFSSRRVTRSSFDKTAAQLSGRTIQSIERRGKHILVTLDRGYLHMHLGMTGQLLWNGATGAHTHAILELDGGVLVYDDPRQFGRVEYSAKMPNSVERLGPDPLTLSFDDFHARLAGHRSTIKPLLLNQAFLGGLGNIYTDEALFAARIHPRTRTQRISRKRSAELFAAIQQLLAAAIEHRGSSVSDYVDGDGERGAFQNLHQVYGKADEPCPRCGTAIRRVVVGQRGTHFCPRCQRA
ncbi:MAG: bifunctional DNA-formamidopyrimidine glycosylase/DNA-(apurinic or apyrimidinic site) lyase [Bryobacteraceae bacterium]